VTGDIRRGRGRLVVCLLGTIGLGLVWRGVLPRGPLAEYPGDALYTVAAFWSLLLVAPAGRRGAIATLAFLGSVAVECSQLLEWPWLVELRSGEIGALLLGQGFQAADLIAYSFGAAGAWGLDRALFGGVTGRAKAENGSSGTTLL